MKIGSHKTEYLNVVFFSEISFHDMNVFVAQQDSINEPKIPRDMDGFTSGEHIFTITIEPDIGQKKVAKFRVKATTNWNDFSMSLIES